jgi:hypothetical protein
MTFLKVAGIKKKILFLLVQWFLKLLNWMNDGAVDLKRKSGSSLDFSLKSFDFKLAIG